MNLGFCGDMTTKKTESLNTAVTYVYKKSIVMHEDPCTHLTFDTSGQNGDLDL